MFFLVDPLSSGCCPSWGQCHGDGSAVRWSFWKMLCSRSESARERGSVPVYLNVYDLTPINGYTSWLGLGVYHSGVQGQFIVSVVLCSTGLYVPSLSSFLLGASDPLTAQSVVVGVLLLIRRQLLFPQMSHPKMARFQCRNCCLSLGKRVFGLLFTVLISSHSRIWWTLFCLNLSVQGLYWFPQFFRLGATLMSSMFEIALKSIDKESLSYI